MCIFGHKYEGYNLPCCLIPGKGRASFHSFSWLHTSRLPAWTLPVASLQKWIQRLQIPVVLLMCASGVLPISLPCQLSGAFWHQLSFSAPASWQSSMVTEARWKWAKTSALLDMKCFILEKGCAYTETLRSLEQNISCENCYCLLWCLGNQLIRKWRINWNTSTYSSLNHKFSKLKPLILNP